MRARAAAAVVASILAAAVLAYLLLAPVPSGASSLSRTADGLFAVRRYVEEQGRHVTLLDRPLHADEAPGTLVIAFPAEVAPSDDELDAVRSFVRRGGRLLLGYSGDRSEPGESRLMGTFGLQTAEPRGRPPLAPARWREWASARWSLRQPGGGGPRLRVRSPRLVPAPPPGSSIWFRADDGTPAVFAFRWGAGSVVALPRRLLANATIGKGDNVSLLARLLATGGAWTFDEYRHGLVGPEAARAEGGAPPAFDLLLLHGALVFAGAALLLGRRFGRPWRERPPMTGSTAGFLRSLGAVHAELRHHGEAARAMLARARELQPRLRVDLDLDVASTAVTASRFVEFAGAVAERQRQAGRES